MSSELGWDGGWDTLFARRTLGIRLGLSIIEGVYEAMGRPAREIPTIHLVGTNGKGSTAAMIEHALRGRGWKTGLYTSPHLHRVGERVRVGGQAVPDEQLRGRVEHALRAERKLSLPRPLSFFELLTLAAFDELAAAEVGVMIVETGLGGRLDATRLCRPTVVAVTSIALDHQAILGSTIAEIAQEKAAVLSTGVPTVSAQQTAEAAEVLGRRAAEVGSELEWVMPLSRAPRGLPGDHQRLNGAVALAAARVLEPSLTVADLDGVQWPGRLETLAWAGGTLVLDVAHNPAGIDAVVDAMVTDAASRPDLVVFGCNPDKDADAMSAALARLGCPRWWVRLPPTHSEALAGQEAWEARFTMPGPELEGALKARLGARERVLVCGSHALVGAVRAWALGIDGPMDPQDPRAVAR